MTNNQITAFTNASGGVPNVVLLSIAGMVVALAIVWLAYTSFQLFHAWRNGNTELLDIPWYIIRGSVVISVLVYFLN